MTYLAIGRLYDVWKNMRGRCGSDNHPSFPSYGGRGITVDSRWEDFDAFAEWCLSNGFEIGLHLDRIDNDGPYSPENCRFVTPSKNQRNKRSNVLLTAFGETKTLVDWLEDDRCTASAAALRQRIARGWDHSRALTTPRWPRKTQCLRGHALTDDNVYVSTSGRKCRACSLAKS